MQYGCIGEKLTHSFSKDIHSKFNSYDYELLEIPKHKLEEFMLKKDFKAINVTIPYKQEVIPFLDFISDTAKKIGAVNTVVNKGGKLYGYNTDFAGMRALIERQKIGIEGKKVLILGSGGTSKTAKAVAESMGASECYRVSRSKSEDCITYEEAKIYHNDAEVIINTTPCGMYPNIKGAAVDIEDYKNLEGVVDAVYNPLCSNLVVKAKSKGINAVGGLYMLVAQAIFAAEHFLDKKIEKLVIEQIYSEILAEKRNIVLTGMPSSGKTTIGKLLSEKLGMKFIDTDEEIVKREGKPISDIFSLLGESGFRDIEAAVIAEVSAFQNTIISTGGGAILRQENIFNLAKNGRIYFIDRPLEALIATEDRPLSSNPDDLKKRYNERYDIYRSTADKIIENKTTAEAAAELIKEDFENENSCY